MRILDSSKYQELLGQMIDIVEDFLTEKGINLKGEKISDKDETIIAGADYDTLSDRFETTLRSWDLIKNTEEKITTRKEMKNLKPGDTFYVHNEEHTAPYGSSLSGDASCDEYVVYDENDNSWFESDFPEYP